MSLEVTIEIPSWSFRKVSFRDGGWHQDFVSILPCPFNYGFAAGTVSEDGEGVDVIVIGPRLRRGARVDVTPTLRVSFIDGGCPDDKLVARLDGAPLSRWDHLVLRLFFLAYVAVKRLRGTLVAGRGVTAVTGYQPISMV